MNDEPSGQLSLVERLLVKVTQPPWFAIYVIPTGFLVFPLFDFTFGAGGPVWALALVFFGILFVLRFGTAFLRRFMPVSRAVENAWFQNRLLAKRYDSYQWQKLFWIGLGILIYARLFERFQNMQIVLAVMCLSFGGLGAALWRSRQKTERCRLECSTTVSETD